MGIFPFPKANCEKNRNSSEILESISELIFRAFFRMYLKTSLLAILFYDSQDFFTESLEFCGANAGNE